MVAETYGAFDSALGPKFVFSSLVLKWESEPVSPRPGRHSRELVGRPSSSRFEGRGARGGLVFFEEFEVFRSAGRLSPPRGSRAEVPAMVKL